MSVRINLIIIISALSLQLATAASRVVTCSHEESKVALKLDSAGKIVKWDARHWAKNEAGSLFSFFAADIRESGLEWSNSFRAPNGYAILELGTTADAELIGVNPDAGKGFYQYKDLGSGSGHKKFEIVCN